MLGGMGERDYTLLTVCAEVVGIPLTDMLERINTSGDFKALMRTVFTNPDMRYCMTPPTPTTGCPMPELGGLRVDPMECDFAITTRTAQYAEAEATFKAKMPGTATPLPTPRR